MSPVLTGLDGGLTISEMSVSLVTDVGIVLEEARLNERGLNASGESVLLPDIRGERPGVIPKSRGWGGWVRIPPGLFSLDIVAELALIDLRWINGESNVLATAPPAVLFGLSIVVRTGPGGEGVVPICIFRGEEGCDILYARFGDCGGLVEFTDRLLSNPCIVDVDVSTGVGGLFVGIWWMSLALKNLSSGSFLALSCGTCVGILLATKGPRGGGKREPSSILDDPTTDLASSA